MPLVAIVGAGPAGLMAAERLVAVDGLDVAIFDAMPSPEDVHARVPLSDQAVKTVRQGRQTLREVLDRKDHRLLVVVGPCSIHDPAAGLDYARRLKALADDVALRLGLVVDAAP